MGHKAMWLTNDVPIVSATWKVVTYLPSVQCDNPDCNPCIMMNPLDKTLLAGLSPFFQLTSFLAKLFNSGELPEDRRKSMVDFSAVP